MAPIVRIPAYSKAAILDTLIRQGFDGGALLDDILNSFQDARVEDIKTGQLVIATAGGGYSTSIALPGTASTLSQPEVAALAWEFKLIKADAIHLLSVAGNSTPTDQQVYAQMMLDDRLEGIRESGQDLTLLGVPSMGTRLSTI